jgi:hypothetical protein
MFSIGSRIRVSGYNEIHTITGIVDDYGYVTSYIAFHEGRPVIMENLYVPLRFASAI